MTVARTTRPGRRVLRRLVKLLAVLMITLAALVAALRLLFPWLVSDPARVARLLAQRLNAPVQVQSSEAQILGATPVLRLRGLRVGEGAEALLLEQADLELDLAALILPWRPVIADLQLSGLDIELRHTEQGLRVLGLPVSRAPFNAMAWADRIGQLSVRNSKVRYRNEAQSIDVSTEHVEARLQRREGRWRFGLRSAEGLQLAGSFQQDAQDRLELWIGADQLPLSDAQQSWLGLRPVSGQLDMDLRVNQDRQGRWSVQGGLGLTDWVYEARAFELSETAGVLQARNRVPQLGLQVRASSANDGSWEVPQLDLSVNGKAGQGSLSGSVDSDWRLALRDVELGPLLDVLGATRLLPEQVSARIYHAQLQGRVQQLSAWLGRADWQVQANIEQLQVRSADPRVPSVAGLDLALQLDRQAAVFELGSTALDVSWPLSLRAPVQIALQANGSAVWPAGEVVLEVDQFSAASGAAAALGNLQLRLAKDQSPYLDLLAQVTQADVQTAKNFWIINKMPPKAVEWLDRALVSGKVDQGAVLFRGPLGKPHWPYREQQGRMDAWVRLHEAVLDYHNDWPRAEQLDTRVQFINDAARVHSARGLVSGAWISATGALPEFKEPVLTLQLDATADAGRWLSFLHDTPVGTRYGSQLVGMQAQGEVAATAQVILPLKRTLGVAQLDGKAQLEGVNFRDHKWLLDFRELKGSASFGRSGFLATGLNVQTPAGNAGRLDVAVGMTANAAHAVEASMSGLFSAQDLFGQHESLAPLLLHLHGRSPWQVELKVPVEREGISTLSAFSTLIGTQIDLPVPLGKDAPLARSLSLSMDFPPESGRPLELAIGDSARARVRLPTLKQDFAGVLRLGAGKIEAELPAAGLSIEGSLQDDDPRRWLELIAGFSAGASADDVGVAGVDLRLQRSGQADGHLRLQRDAVGGGWNLAIDSASAAGEVIWSPGSTRASLTADLQRLHLPKPASGDSDALRGIRPAGLPTLHVRATDFRVGEIALGQLRLETFPTATGMRVDQLETQSPQLVLRGSGNWEMSGVGQRSEFDLRFSADDLGRMLASLGFAGPVSGGQTLATIQAAWPGSPTNFGLERLDGKLEVWVGRGRFLEVEPGAGRLFGLLSFTELPRRLSLDFRDFFQSGMAFDEIRGIFTLGEGNAWTQDLLIKAPAAEILIIGRTGVAARDYDQQMIVSPKVGGVLPWVGAIAGGPGGAAAGLLAQGVLSRDRAAFLREYRIGGTWEKPSILRQEAQRQRPAAGPSAPITPIPPG